MSFFFICIEKIIYAILIFCVKDILATGALLIGILLGLIKSYYEWHTMIEVKLYLKRVLKKKEKNFKKI